MVKKMVFISDDIFYGSSPAALELWGVGAAVPHNRVPWPSKSAQYKAEGRGEEGRASPLPLPKTSQGLCHMLGTPPLTHGPLWDIWSGD